MAQLRLDYQEFVNKDAAIIAVGPEKPADFTAFWTSWDMPFTGIPDPDHRIAGVYKQQVDILKLGRMPAMFVIDKEGRIRYKHYGKSMSDIPEDKDILAILDIINREKGNSGRAESEAGHV